MKEYLDELSLAGEGIMDKKVWMTIGAGLLLSCFVVGKLEAAQVSPTPQTTVDHSGTATGSAVTVLADGSSVAGYRVDCTLQNNGNNVMYYSFTGTATTSSRQLKAGFVMNCAGGTTVDSQALSLLGTNGDTYSLTEAFVRAQ